jgi:hypothetical protein
MFSLLSFNEFCTLCKYVYVYIYIYIYIYIYKISDILCGFCNMTDVAVLG